MKTFKEYITEKMDFENVSKPPKSMWNTPKWDGVSLGKTKGGKFFVYTHRCRSDEYDRPEDIPKSEVEYIESTG